MDFSTVGSIVAILIGVLALAVSIWQGIEIRNNYRLAVTPSIRINHNWSPEAQYSGIGIRNDGVGPAIIKDFIVTKGENSYTLNEFIDIIMESVRENIGQHSIKRLNYFLFDEFSVLAVNEDQPLIWLSNGDKENRQNIILLCSAFEGISLEIRYKSLYGKEYTLKTNIINPFDEITLNNHGISFSNI